MPDSIYKLDKAQLIEMVLDEASEIEKLRAECEHLKADSAAARAGNVEAMCEIVRLRAANEKLESVAQSNSDWIAQNEPEIARLQWVKAEYDRARAAIANARGAFMDHQAVKALEALQEYYGASDPD